VKAALAVTPQAATVLMLELTQAALLTVLQAVLLALAAMA
jgi:hypothetical protein